MFLSSASFFCRSNMFFFHWGMSSSAALAVDVEDVEVVLEARCRRRLDDGVSVRVGGWGASVPFLGLCQALALDGVSAAPSRNHGLIVIVG